jgi:uncharacterized phage protein (TIGR01671 family)
MREIKFRAWHKIEKRMIYHNPILSVGNPIITFNGNVYERGKLLDNDIEIMQYAGLKDKNGKEIYEGDIVKFLFNETEGYEIGEVRYGKNSPSFGFYVKKDNVFSPITNFISGTLCMVAEYDFEIIGNIYENPSVGLSV